MTESSDEELARLAQDGSKIAFEAMMARYGESLLRHLKQKVHRDQDAEDLRQEIYIKIYQNLHRYDPTRPFSNWLFTIASNQIVNFYRSRKESGELDEFDLPSKKPDPHEVIAQKEFCGNVWSIAQRALSENQYQAIMLRYAKDMSVKDIAHSMGKSQTHVKVLLFRARKKLLNTRAMDGILTDLELA